MHFRETLGKAGRAGHGAGGQENEELGFRPAKCKRLF